MVHFAGNEDVYMQPRRHPSPQQIIRQTLDCPPTNVNVEVERYIEYTSAELQLHTRNFKTSVNSHKCN